MSKLDIAKALFGDTEATSSGNQTTMRYGTAQSDAADNKVTVLLDGSDAAITVSTYENVSEGQRVTVYNSDGVLKAFCMGSGSISGSMISADEVLTDKLYANQAFIDNLYAESASIADAHIESATIKQAQVENLNADYAHITDGAIDNATIGCAKVTDLSANYAHIDNGVIDNATIGYANVNDLDANYAHISEGVIDNATIGYADVNVANVTKEWVDTLLVQGQAIVASGTTYYLDSIHVNAESIDAGTIRVDRLYVKDSEGNYKLLQVDGETTTWVEPADMINDGTLIAEKLVANSITADQITTENIVGTGGWINMTNGTFEYVNATTKNGISWDGSNLNIKASSVTIGTTAAATTTDVSTAVDGVEVGGRNYIANSASLVGGKIYGKSTNEYQDLDVGNLYDGLDGETVTLSFDLEYICATDSFYLHVYNTNNKGPVQIAGVNVPTPASFKQGATIKERVSVTTTLKARSSSEISQTHNYIEFYSQYKTGRYFGISNLKLEKGNKATDWTPAPEDVSDDIAEAKKAAIEVAAEAIRSYVSAAGGSTSYTQTSSGFTWSIDSNMTSVTDSTARSSASSAASTASTALSQANTAINDANTANNTATNAKNAASTAQTTANNAATAASNATKVATNYLSFDSTNGLVVGNMTTSLTGNVQITAYPGVYLRNNTTNLAAFTPTYIGLGMNGSTTQRIGLCADKGNVKYDSGGLWLETPSSASTPANLAATGSSNGSSVKCSNGGLITLSSTYGMANLSGNANENKYQVTLGSNLMQLYSASNDIGLWWCNGSNEDYPLKVDSNGVTMRANYFTNRSSRDYKENIEEIPSEDAERLLLLKPSTFDFKPEYGGAKGCAGFIAEDTYEVFPRMVRTDTDKDGKSIISLDMTQMIPYLVKMVQDQQAEIDSLTARVAAMEEALGLEA